MPALRAGGWDVVSTGRRAGSGATHALDVTDRRRVQSFIRSVAPVDAVVHLAAIAHNAFWSVPWPAYDRVNHLGLRNVLQAAREAGVGRFIFFSSSVVYGETEGPIRFVEDSERRPVGPYGRSKRAAEGACFEEMERGSHVIILRFPAVYASDWLRDLRSRACVPFTGGRFLLKVVGSEREFSLCGAENAVDVVLFALRSDIEAGVYNVADARPYSERELLDVVGELDGVRITLPVPKALFWFPVWAGSAFLPGALTAWLRSRCLKLIVGTVLDTSKIQRVGFSPRWSLQDMVSGRMCR